MTEIHDRLKQARINAGYETVQDACEAFGFKYPTYAGHENGQRGVRGDSLARYAKAFKVSVEWLLTGSGKALKQVEDDFESIPIFDLDVSAGAGTLANDGDVLGYQPFREQQLRRMTRAPIEKLAVIMVRGDSMDPTLANQDQILVDTTIHKIGRDGIYILALGEELLVKRCQVDLQTGDIIVQSDNPAYETMRVSNTDRAEVKGRVIWIGRALG